MNESKRVESAYFGKETISAHQCDSIRAAARFPREAQHGIRACVEYFSREAKGDWGVIGLGGGHLVLHTVTDCKRALPRDLFYLGIGD